MATTNEYHDVAHNHHRDAWAACNRGREATCTAAYLALRKLATEHPQDDELRRLAADAERASATMSARTAASDARALVDAALGGDEDAGRLAATAAKHASQAAAIARTRAAARYASQAWAVVATL